MAVSHVARDRQAEAGAALVPGACVVQPHEPFEDALSLLLRHPGPVVGHGQHDPAAIRAYGGGHRGVRVPLGVVEQIAEHPGQLTARTGHLQPLRHGHLDRYPVAGPSGHLLGQQLRRVQPRQTRPLPRVQPCQQQQVGGQLLQAHGVLHRSGHVQQLRVCRAHPAPSLRRRALM